MLSKQLSPTPSMSQDFSVSLVVEFQPKSPYLSVLHANQIARSWSIYMISDTWTQHAPGQATWSTVVGDEMRWDVWFAFTRQRCHRASLASKLGQQSIPSVKFIRKSTFSKHLNKSKHVLSSVTTCFLFILCILSIMCPDPLIHSMIILLLFSHCEDHTATNYHVLHYTTFGH